MVTYDALLSVNYLLIILFILAATTPLSSTQHQRNFSLKIIPVGNTHDKNEYASARRMFVTCHVNVALDVDRSIRYKLASKHVSKHGKHIHLLRAKMKKKLWKFD